jgi:hypothetical protein
MFNGAFHIWLAYKNIPTDRNYLSVKTDVGYYPMAFAHSGGTRTLISKVESGEIRSDFVVLVAPILISQAELQKLVDENVVKKIIIFQSSEDVYFSETVTIDVVMPEGPSSDTNSLTLSIMMPLTDAPYGLSDDDIKKYSDAMKNAGIVSGGETAYWGRERSKQKVFENYPDPIDKKDAAERIIVIKRSYGAGEDADIANCPHNLLRDDMVRMFTTGEYPFDGKIKGLAKNKA